MPLLPLWAVRPLQSLSACTVELYLYSPYGAYGLYRASVSVEYSYTSTPPMGRTASTEPQCLYSRTRPLLPLWAVRPVQSLSACTVQLYLYSPCGSYSLYRASVPVRGCTLLLPFYFYGEKIFIFKIEISPNVIVKFWTVGSKVAYMLDTGGTFWHSVVFVGGHTLWPQCNIKSSAYASLLWRRKLMILTGRVLFKCGERWHCTGHTAALCAFFF